MDKRTLIVRTDGTVFDAGDGGIFLMSGVRVPPNEPTDDRHIADTNKNEVVRRWNAFPEFVESLKQSVACMEHLDKLLLDLAGQKKECDRGEVARAKEVLAAWEPKV